MAKVSTNISLVLCLFIISNQIILFTNSNNITCLNDGLCHGKPIICNDNEHCYISCDERDACYYSIVQCPMNAQCNIFCGMDRNSCDDITINATHSTLLHVFCADNECDDATLYCPHNGPMGTDHQCILQGVKAIDRVKLYTEEGFHDINIENIELTESTIFCGADAQYSCAINADESGCEAYDDPICDTYRLPSISPTSSPTFQPSIVPIISPSKNPAQYQDTYNVTNTPITAPTNAPIQMYNNGDARLEFYIYYNDTNGINMIFAKWMKQELLNSYDEFSAVSSKNAQWSTAGILNMTFCTVFNMYYHDNDYCQRFKEYGYSENDQILIETGSGLNAEYVAYGTFGIYSDESINSFQLFVIDTFTSYLFKQSFNLNMNARIKAVGFEDRFEAIMILVQPFDPITKQNSINSRQAQNAHANHLNVILGVLLGIICALITVLSIYGVRYYNIRRTKSSQLKGKNGKSGTNEGMSGIDKEHSETPTYGGILTPDQAQLSNNYYYDQPQPGSHSKLHKLHKMDKDEDPYQEDDKLMAPSRFLAKLQNAYLSTDNESENDENEEKLQVFCPDDNPSTDSNDNKSVISSIISFGKRKLSHSKKRKRRKHQRARTMELHEKSAYAKRKKIKKHRRKRTRSLHWGFTDNGSDIHSKHGENGSVVHAEAYSLNALHVKSQSAFTMNNSMHSTDSTLPELQLQFAGNSLRQLEIARNSSFHSHNVNVNPQLSSSFTFNSNNCNASSQGNKSQKVSVEIIDDDKTINMSDAQFIAALSPSINSIEDMYGSPSPDGIQWTGGRIPVFRNAAPVQMQSEVTLKNPLSPIQNQANLDLEQIEMNINVLPVIANEADECEDDTATVIML